MGRVFLTLHCNGGASLFGEGGRGSMDRPLKNEDSIKEGGGGWSSVKKKNRRIEGFSKPGSPLHQDHRCFDYQEFVISLMLTPKVQIF